MPWNPSSPLLMADEQTNELGKWAFEQMQHLAAQLENPNETQYNVLHAEPAKPREGMVVVADGTDWNPGSGGGQYIYIGGVWTIQRTGPEPNTYGIMTDGTNSAPAEAAGDTFKYRAAAPIAVVVGNDDVTHGDNLLISFAFGGLSSVTPVLNDKVILGDTSNSDTPIRTTVQDLFNLINSLTTESAPDFSADFLALYDTSGSAAKKMALSGIQKAPVLVNTVTLSGSSTDVPIPSGYRDILLKVLGMSSSSNNLPTVAFSENAGSSFLALQYYVFSQSAVQGGPVTGARSLASGVISAANALDVRMTLFDYTSSRNKLVNENGGVASSIISLGQTILTSTTALNLVRFATSAGTFDAGSVEVWGIS